MANGIGHSARSPPLVFEFSISNFKNTEEIRMFYDLKESGARIQALRKQKGLTQEQLAEKLNINTNSLGKIERGLNGLSIDLLIEIGVFFGTSLDYIILGREFQVDVTKKALGSIINQLVNLEQKL